MTIQDLKLTYFYFCRSSLSPWEKSFYWNLLICNTLVETYLWSFPTITLPRSLIFSLNSSCISAHAPHSPHTFQPSVCRHIGGQKSHLAKFNMNWLIYTWVWLHFIHPGRIRNGREMCGLVHLFLSHHSFIGGIFLPNNWSIDNSAHLS